MLELFQSESYIPPSWTAGLKHAPPTIVSLAVRPTPVHRWRAPGLDGLDLWIKRDDLTGITLSGNKVRKLEFLLAEARSQGADVVLTCGGIQSNHARATAIAARHLGLDSVLVLRTAHVDIDPGLQGNLLLDRMAGAEIRLITPDQYRQRNEIMAEHAQALREQGRRPYIIPEGGSNATGGWGYIEMIAELIGQSSPGAPAYDDLVFACGSGGTAAGLALAVHLSKYPARVHAVNVCDDAACFHRRVNDILDELGSAARSEQILDIIDGYVGRGYAQSRPEELDLLASIARTSGIILDPVYSGKAVFGLVHEWAGNRERFKGDRILFIHTGGLFGLYDKLEELKPVISKQ